MCYVRTLKCRMMKRNIFGYFFETAIGTLYLPSSPFLSPSIQFRPPLSCFCPLPRYSIRLMLLQPNFNEACKLKGGRENNRLVLIWENFIRYTMPLSEIHGLIFPD